MERKTIAKMVLLCLPLLMAACGTKKAAIDNNVSTGTARVATSQTVTGVAFVQKVVENQVSAKNIVGDMSFNIKMGDKDITVPGSIHMRRNEVIRLQLFIPLLGSEVGRVEFTPNEVLVVDRMHKEYVQANYSQLDFLKNNGLNFYSLQALFWNELMMPGASAVSQADYPAFEVGSDNGTQTMPLSLKKGNLAYQWQATKGDGQITSAIVSYQNGRQTASDLTWTYGNFIQVDMKQFPANQNVKFTTTSSNKLKKVEVNIKMKEVKTTEKWETKTTVSSKYKKVEAKDVLGKLLRM